MANNKIVIYTAIFGNQDDLIEPKVDIDNADLVFFTDKLNVKSEKFDIRKIPGVYDDLAMNARMLKMHPHILFPEYEYSIWVDGRVDILIDDPQQLIDKYLKKSNFALFQHMHRNCLYIEAKECILRYKDRQSKITNQMIHYSLNGYPEQSGMVETGVLIRRHMSNDVIRFNERWWAELLRFSRRDQLSFNYLAWKTGFKYSKIDGHIWHNKFFKLSETHKNGTK